MRGNWSLSGRGVAPAPHINAGMLAMVVGLILVPAVSLLTQKTKPAGTEEIFACYDRLVTVPVGTALEDEV